MLSFVACCLSPLLRGKSTPPLLWFLVPVHISYPSAGFLSGETHAILFPPKFVSQKTPKMKKVKKWDIRRCRLHISYFFLPDWYFFGVVVTCWVMNGVSPAEIMAVEREKTRGKVWAKKENIQLWRGRHHLVWVPEKMSADNPIVSFIFFLSVCWEITMRAEAF